jgi:hypothetical protein
MAAISRPFVYLPVSVTYGHEIWVLVNASTSWANSARCRAVSVA